MPITPFDAVAALGFPLISELTPIKAGWGATALWKFRTRPSIWPGWCLLRLRAADEGARRAMRREVAAYRAAATAGIPVPVVIASGDVEGQPAMILSWSDGVPGLDVLSDATVDPATLGKTCGVTLAAIHAIPAPDELQAPPDADWISWAGEVGERLRPYFDRVDPSEQSRLIHLDFHPLNLLFDLTTASLTAVLDWENATAGDPRADLARTWAIMTFAVTMLNLSPRMHAVAARFFTGCLAGWEERHGPAGDLAPHQLWARAAQIADLAPKLGRPDVSLQPEHLAWLREDVERRIVALNW